MVIAAGDDIQRYLIQVAKTGHDRSLMCKKRCAKRTFTKEELVGPGKRRYSIIIIMLLIIIILIIITKGSTKTPLIIEY